MTAHYLTSGIDSWQQITRESSPFGDETRSSIDTASSPPQPDPKWDECINELLHSWERAPLPNRAAEDERPGRHVFHAVLQWLMELRGQIPDAPPTMIGAEPAGGLIVEWRATAATGHELISELTIYNDRRAEWTSYIDGKVIEMEEIPFDVPRP